MLEENESKYHREIEIVGTDGRKRRMLRNEIPRPGETISFGPGVALCDAMNAVMAMTDSAAEPKPQPDHTVRDAHGTASGNRPGYAFAAQVDNASLRGAATQSYVERCQWLESAWRDRGQPHEEAKLVAGGEFRHQPLATTDAEQAWQDKKQRLEQAWRRHRA